MSDRIINKYTVECNIKIEHDSDPTEFLHYQNNTEFDSLGDAITFAKIISQWENAAVTLYGYNKNQWEEYPVLIEI